MVWLELKQFFEAQMKVVWGIGQNLRKDDSFVSTLGISNEYISVIEGTAPPCLSLLCLQ